MISSRKPSTLEKLDRDKLLPWSITDVQFELYEEDQYKYLIHVFKMLPDDPLNILQFLLMRFHPLIINTCSKFAKKEIPMDWLDLLSFTRHSFIQLLLRYDLNSRLYFRVYIKLALDRAVNDYYTFLMRRVAIQNATRLDLIPDDLREVVLHQHAEEGIAEKRPENLKEQQRECLEFLRDNPNLSQTVKQLFNDRFIGGMEIAEISDKYGITKGEVKRLLHACTDLLRDFLRGREEPDA